MIWNKMLNCQVHTTFIREESYINNTKIIHKQCNAISQWVGNQLISMMIWKALLFVDQKEVCIQLIYFLPWF